MRRRLATALVLLSIVLVPAVPASVGGSWVYPDRGAYVPGDLARLHGSFSLRGSLEGSIADGPYVADLLPEGTWIGSTRVPADAIRLGELRISRAEGTHPTRAVVTFTVPDVPAGWYHVGYCNQPCTVNGIGDLIGSWRFVVAPTRSEGRRLRQVDRLEHRIDSALRKAHAHARVEQNKLERALEARSTALDEARRRIAALESTLANRPVGQASQGRTLVAGWAGVVLAVALVAAALIVARRRTPAFDVPDTVPDDLVDRERVPTR